MNQKLSAVAFVVFFIAWAFDLASDADITGLMNVGFMWLAMAAIVGRETT